MREVYPKDWLNSAGLQRQDIQQRIKQDSAKICKRRSEMAKSLEEQVVRVEEKSIQLKAIIDIIRESLAAEKNPIERSTIEDSCNDLLNKLYDYKSKLSALQRRFNNQKIRILSFGNKSQGKSSFTKAYTNLPDKVVGTKESGDKDKTGATSVIIHKKGIDVNNPEIHVIFKKPDRIRDIVNECFFQLGLAHHYDSWGDLYQMLGNKALKSQLYNEVKNLISLEIVGFDSLKNTLLNILDNVSDFEDINSGNDEYFDVTRGKVIKIDQLPEYNDMQNPVRQCYTSVSEILIYADLGHNDMFENIEVCDTKGTSIDAGGAMWEKELYRIMGNSDAVFSIQMTCGSGVGGNDSKFYASLKNEIAKNDHLLKDMKLKHFAVLNLYKEKDGIITDTPEKVMMILRGDLANTTYVGALADGVVYEGKTLQCQDFVDYVILDMMQEIVKTTEQTDNNLLKDCDQAISDIKQKKDELVNLLSVYDKVTPKNKEDIIRDAIRQWLIEEGCPNVRNQLKDIARNENLQLNHFQEPDNGNYGNNTSQKSSDNRKLYNPWSGDSETSNNDLEEKEEIQYKVQQADDTKQNEALYQMITGNICNPKDVKGKGEDEIVKKAIRALYVSLKPRIGTREGEQWTETMGCVHNIGAYIDSIANLMRDQIMNNINYVFAPSKDVPGSQDFKDTVFKKVWDALKLDVAYQEFDGTLLRRNKEDERFENERLDNWSKGYNVDKQDGFSTPIEGCPSFIILKEYFDAIQPLSKQEFGSMLDSYDYIIDEGKLVEALQKAYLKYDLAERCKEKQSEVLGWKTKLVHFLKADVNHGEFISQMIDLYKYACPDNYVRKLTEAGILDSSIEEDYENQIRVAELKNQRLRLSTFLF